MVAIHSGEDVSTSGAIGDHPLFAGLASVGSALMPLSVDRSPTRGSIETLPSRWLGSENLVNKRLALLADRWHRETGMLSTPSRILSNEHYLAILATGAPAIPFILRDLRDHGGRWYAALRALTGVDPVPRDAKGFPILMKQAWLDWGRAHGYLV
jgi:hypothetical protein